MPKPLLILTAIVPTLVYVGLAVLGEGGFAAFFSRPALTALVIVTAMLVGAALCTSANLSAGEREDRANRWVIWALLVIGLLDGFLPAYTDHMEFWTIDGDGLRWIGVVLYAVGGALRLWPVFVLGRRFSGLVAIQKGHELVTDGIYAVIRHPSYLGLLVNMLGWGLAFRSGVGVLLVVVTLIPILARIRSEEAMLSSQFGSAYESYRARTWRLVPGLY
ncbi:MAG TPA: isoprenylcysteine carboxylmethyltransferase family protein [Stellaceae bacterium]|nr:isoprenylcysteine carboxylmethyltransferase family protein [Stellaceae bacterium]